MARIVADRLAGSYVVATPFPRQHARFVNSSFGDPVIVAMKRLYSFPFMSHLRQFFSAAWLALALVLGQQAAQLHDLGHAIQRISTDSQDQHPGSDTCDKCSLYAPFSGAAAAFIAPPVVLTAAIVAALSAFLPAQSRTVVSSRSRAPPSLL